MTFLDCTCVPENLGPGECPVHQKELREMEDHYNQRADQLEAQADGLRKASGEVSASQPERTWTLHNYYWLGSRYVMCECINGGEATCSKDGHVPVVEQAALTYWQDKAANFEAGQAEAYRQLAAETARANLLRSHLKEHGCAHDI